MPLTVVNIHLYVVGRVVGAHAPGITQADICVGGHVQVELHRVFSHTGISGHLQNLCPAVSAALHHPGISQLNGPGFRFDKTVAQQRSAVLKVIGKGQEPRFQAIPGGRYREHFPRSIVPVVGDGDCAVDVPGDRRGKGHGKRSALVGIDRRRNIRNSKVGVVAGNRIDGENGSGIHDGDLHGIAFTHQQVSEFRRALVGVNHTLRAQVA